MKRSILVAMTALTLLVGAGLFWPVKTRTLASLKRDFNDRYVRTLALASGTTHYEDQGQGPVVIMIHGVSGPMQVWDRNVDALVEAGYRVVRYDLLGRGFSQRSTDTAYDLPTYVRQLEELVSTLQLGSRIWLVGSSFGAVIATEYALHHVDTVEGLVLIGPAGFPIELPPLAGLRDVPLVGPAVTRARGRAIIREQNRKYAIDPDRLQSFWPYFDAQLDVEGTMEALLATMRNAPVTDYVDSYRELGQTRLPVGIIWGRQDATFPYAHHETLLAAVPGAKLVTLEHAAHLPQLEQAEVTNAALLELLKLAPEATPQASSRLSLSAGIDEQLDAPPVPVSEAFETPFFQRFDSVERVRELAPGISRTYTFPTFYADVTTGLALFVCDYDAAARLIPDPGLKPIRAGLGTALVAISSYRYERPRGLRPYNEVAISLLVTDRDTLDLPLTGLLGLQKRELHAYVIAMPVTTLENQLRGRTIWGLPKTVEHIQLRQVGGDFVTTIRDREGRLMLETRVPMSGNVESQEQSVILHSMLDGRAVRSRATSTGTFASRLTPGPLSGPPAPGGASSLSLGTAAGADVLRELHIRPTPLNTRFARGVSSTFTLPLDG